jgi:hypothetical protein
MAREGLRSAECRVVKKRVRRCGGEDVGCEVSAFRSHCSTEILCACSGYAQRRRIEEKKVRFGCRAGQVSR